jgi:hypothetical protein
MGRVPAPKEETTAPETESVVKKEARPPSFNVLLHSCKKMKKALTKLVRYSNIKPH